LRAAIVILALTLGSGFSGSERTDVPREIISLDAGWRFYLGDHTNAADRVLQNLFFRQPPKATGCGGNSAACSATNDNRTFDMHR